MTSSSRSRVRVQTKWYALVANKLNKLVWSSLCCKTAACEKQFLFQNASWMDLFEKRFGSLSRQLMTMQQMMAKLWDKECGKTSILKFIKARLPPAYETMYPIILEGVGILEKGLLKSSTFPGCEGWWWVTFGLNYAPEEQKHVNGKRAYLTTVYDV